MVGVDAFVEALRQLGYEPEHRGNGLVAFDYEVEVGPLAGHVVKLALQVPGDWPASPPGGLMVSPRLLPINTDASLGHPRGAVHEAPQLGSDWEYWSRPFHAWPTTDRTAAAYMSYVRRLFDTLPDDLDEALPDAA